MLEGLFLQEPLENWLEELLEADLGYSMALSNTSSIIITISFSISRTLFENFLKNKVFTNFWLESSQPFFLSVEPFVDLLVVQTEIVLLKFLFHLPFPFVNAKFVPDGVFPPSPRYILMAVSDANVPIVGSISEKSS